MQNTSIIILAAGRGTRLGADVPKPLVKIGETPLIEPILNKSLELSDDVIVVTSRFTRQVEIKYGDWPINFLENEPKGTGACTLAALEIARHEQILVAQADDSFFLSKQVIENFVKFHEEKQYLFSVALTHLTQEVQYSPVLWDPKFAPDRGEFLAIVPNRNAPAPKDTMGGLYIGNRKWMLDRLTELNTDPGEGEVGLPSLAELASDYSEPVGAFMLPDGAWLGINSPEDLKEAIEKSNSIKPI